MVIKFGHLARPKAGKILLAARAQAMLARAVAMHQQGQTSRAQMLYEEILKMQPTQFQVLHLLGVLAFQAENYAKALDLVNRALAIKPDFAAAYSIGGLSLQGLQQFDAALASYDKAIAIKPDYTEAHYNRGNVLQDLHLLGAAVASYDQAIALNPGYAEAYCNRGNALQGLQQFDNAIASYDKAIAIHPNLAEAHCNRGNALQRLQQFDNAVASYDQAIAINPNFSEAYSNRGNVLRNLRQLESALASYDQAITFNPDYAEAYSNRGLALQAQKQLDAAVANFDKAIAINPNYAGAHSNRGLAMQDLQQIDEAITSFQKAIAIKPDYAVAYENRLFCLSHSYQVDARQLYAEHQAFGNQFETPLRADWQAHDNVKDPARCLQVGFVSGDLRDHAVAHFLEPVLQFLSKKSTLALHAYATHTIDDKVSRRLRTCFAHWHAVDHLGDAELANKIRADGIDILIDLSGHTAHNRLLAFARKPAPIQATWIGYPGTTGLQAVDYLLCDRFWIPPELAWQLAEKPAYLPAFVIFRPDELSPPVNPLPALKNGYITFGSFNRPAKINPSVIRLWSLLLRSIPTARLAIGAVPPDLQGALTQSLAGEGIAPSRITLFPHTNMRDYLAQHHQVDICFDAFPYGGNTTTLHAAWMGVPILTLIGETLPSRASSASMRHMGLSGFVATSSEDFVSKGCYWAEHIEELATLRLGMRTRFNESALGRPEQYCDALEAILRTMWQRWCSDLPRVAIEAKATSQLEHKPSPTADT